MNEIPMLDLKLEYEYMKNDIDLAIRKCLEHQKWILGPEVKELETTVAEYLGVKHCIGASSGTEALVLSLRALAIKITGREYFTSDEQIITTPFTFTATGDAILRSGATPVFADIDPASFNIDPQQIRNYISSANRKVVGILPVHLYGKSCQMDEIMTIAKDHGLFVVEDVAQAFGGTWKSKKLGSIGTTGCFSFFPSKNLGGFGDGGLVSTNDDSLAELVRMLLKHGGKDKYNVDHIGYNARLDTLQAAVILAKLRYLDEFNNKRVRIAQSYNEELRGATELLLPEISEGHVFHQYTVRVAGRKRDALQKKLQSSGINTMVYYPVPLHVMRVFSGRHALADRTCANAEQIALEVLSLPIEPLMKDGVIKTIASNIKSATYHTEQASV